MHLPSASISVPPNEPDRPKLWYAFWLRPSLIAPLVTPARSSSVVAGAVVTVLLSYHMATALRDSGTM